MTDNKESIKSKEYSTITEYFIDNNQRKMIEFHVDPYRLIGAVVPDVNEYKQVLFYIANNLDEFRCCNGEDKVFRLLNSDFPGYISVASLMAKSNISSISDFIIKKYDMNEYDRLMNSSVNAWNNVVSDLIVSENKDLTIGFIKLITKLNYRFTISKHNESRLKEFLGKDFSNFNIKVKGDF